MSVIHFYEERKKIKEKITESIDNIALIFIDMTGSTAHKDEVGIELGVEKVILFNLDITEIIKEKGEEYKKKGEIEEYIICKYIGDEVMAYFKGGNSSKVAIEIAIHIQKHFKDINRRIKNELERYKPKIGIDFGEVLFAKYDKNLPLDPHGLIVDRAARIVSLSKPCQILISGEAKNHTGNKISVKFAGKERKAFKGIKEKTVVYEIIWDKEIGKLGIKVEENPYVFMIPADASTVNRFIEDNDLLDRSNQIDLILYTYETLSSILRDALEKLQTSLTLRVIIRNPQKDSKKRSKIKSSIGTMKEVIDENPKINFEVRFYDDEPLLRAYIFHKENGEAEGLLGLYRYDPKHSIGLVGAENNHLIHANGRSFFEKHLLTIFQSRFDHMWKKLTKPKAIIFDLDGVIIDSMPFYYKAWKNAFKTVGIDVSKKEIYIREGEKREITAKEVYKKYKGKEPSDELIDIIVQAKEKEYHNFFKLKVVPGAVELLSSLKGKNIKLGLVTGSVTKTIGKLRTKDPKLFSLFDVIVTGEDTKIGKPSPKPYELAIKRLGIPACNCYAVENAPLGIISAINADLTCFAVKGPSILSKEVLKNAGAYFVYNSIEELKEHFIWAGTNMHLKEFLDIFGDELGKE